MPRFSVAGRTANVPTAARGPALAATTAVRPVIREIGAFNTTTTASAISVSRISAIGASGAALTEICEGDDSHVAIAIGTGVPTADHTVVAGPLRYASLGAAIGSGVIWTFGGNGLVIDNVATQGVSILCHTGTGQHLDFYIVWDE